MIQSPYAGVLAALLLIGGIAGVASGLEPVGYLLLVVAVVGLAANAVANLQERRRAKTSSPR